MSTMTETHEARIEAHAETIGATAQERGWALHLYAKHNKIAYSLAYLNKRIILRREAEAEREAMRVELAERLFPGKACDLDYDTLRVIEHDAKIKAARVAHDAEIEASRQASREEFSPRHP